MRYKHDCDKCVYLGEYGDADLYFCNQSGIKTVIARYSDEPSDYISGMEFTSVNKDLMEAKKRAISFGAMQ